MHIHPIGAVTQALPTYKQHSTSRPRGSLRRQLTRTLLGTMSTLASFRISTTPNPFRSTREAQRLRTAAGNEMGAQQQLQPSYDDAHHFAHAAAATPKTHPSVKPPPPPFLLRHQNHHCASKLLQVRGTPLGAGLAEKQPPVSANDGVHDWQAPLPVCQAADVDVLLASPMGRLISSHLREGSRFFHCNDNKHSARGFTTRWTPASVSS